MPLKDHLATLSRLLVKKEETKLEDFFERLLFYIIAACHRKMLRRIDHTTMSKPFVKSLKGIREVNIAATFNEEFGHPHNDTERAHDIKFLQTLLVVETFVIDPVSPPADPSPDTPATPSPDTTCNPISLTHLQPHLPTHLQPHLSRRPQEHCPKSWYRD